MSKSQEQLIREALQNLVAADNCNYERDTMRYAGLFDKAREALGWKAKEQVGVLSFAHWDKIPLIDSPEQVPLWLRANKGATL